MHELLDIDTQPSVGTLDIPRTPAEKKRRNRKLNNSHRMREIRKQWGLTRAQTKHWKGVIPDKYFRKDPSLRIGGVGLAVWRKRLAPLGLTTQILRSGLGVSASVLSGWTTGTHMPSRAEARQLEDLLAPYIKQWKERK